MNPTEQYINDRDEQVRKNMADVKLSMATYNFTEHLVRTNYVKNFTWMGRPILQYPTDLMVMQELIWEIKPDVIIELGVAMGGMTMFYASMLEMVGKGGIVVGVDIEIREHNLKILRQSPLYHENICLIEADSVSPEAVNKVKSYISPGNKVLVSLDSNHSHAHVLKELQLYSPLVTVGSYCVVFDTAIEFFGHLDKNQDRPWGAGNNPYTAVQEFLANDDFSADREVEQRALVTAAVGGWLRRVK